MALGNYGIIFHDLFVDETLFLQAFKDYYKEKQADIETTVAALLGLLNSYNVQEVTKGMASQFQELWEKFQLQVLGNEQPLQLLVAYRDGLGENAQFSQILEQRQVEETVKTKRGYTYGINTGNTLIQDSFKIIQARQVEKFLQEHLGQLLNQLYYEHIERSVAEALHDYHSHLLHDIYTTSNMKKRQHITGLPWYKLIYGNMGWAQWQGNAYEAYFNHMANHEPVLFDYLSQHGKETMAEFNLKIHRESVFSEEGGYEPDLGHFPELMMGQINSIPWFAGGDIVIINDKMEVIYNIQLKTTTQHSQTVFAEKVAQLKQFLINFVSAETVDEKAKILFDSFKNTTANTVENYLGDSFAKTLEEHLYKKLEQSIPKH